MKNDNGLLQRTDQRLDWYLQSRFGLFIHWGAYSVGGLEASWPIMAPDLAEVMFATQTRIHEVDYTNLPAKFNPLDFDAAAWVRTAQAAGMRYIVVTAKHHDGFCMFDAPGTDYKITNTPFGRDICLELSQACATAGMPLGFYYSPPDMHHPGYRDKRKPAVQNWLGEPDRPEWAAYLDYMESHLRKLLTGYGDVRILWFDGLANHAKYDPPRFHKLVHELSPNTLINDRLGDGYDFITPEQFIPKAGIPVRTGKPPSGNDPGGEKFFRLILFLYKLPLIRSFLRRQLEKYAQGELELTSVPLEPYPSPDRFQPWETCMTMGGSWAFNPYETTWKNPQKLIHNLVEVVSRGGNYLLNVGPTAQGTFPPEALERLEYIGRWVKSYSAAVYGSTYTPLQNLSFGQATRAGNKVYLHILSWPADNLLKIDSFPGRVDAVALFSGEALEFNQTGQSLEISVPAQPPDPDVSVLVVEVDAAAKGWEAYSQPVPIKSSPSKYLRTQAVASGIINAVINFVIAFFAYRSRAGIPFAEVAVDILITVAIISFLVSWIAVGLARQQVSQGVLALDELPQKSSTLSLPANPVLRALLITLGCVLGFGGIIMIGFLYLFSPDALSSWAYIGIKTGYTGVCAALAAVLAIRSVYSEHKRS